MPLKWLLEQQFAFLRALLFVIMDLTNEVSSGAIDLSKNILEELIVKCCKPLQPSHQHLDDIQKASIKSVLHELVREVTSPNKLVREQVNPLSSSSSLASVMSNVWFSRVEKRKREFLLADAAAVEIFPPSYSERCDSL